MLFGTFSMLIKPSFNRLLFTLIFLMKKRLGIRN